MCPDLATSAHHYLLVKDKRAVTAGSGLPCEAIAFVSLRHVGGARACYKSAGAGPRALREDDREARSRQPGAGSAGASADRAREQISARPDRKPRHDRADAD